MKDMALVQNSSVQVEEEPINLKDGRQNGGILKQIEELNNPSLKG